MFSQVFCNTAESAKPKMNPGPHLNSGETTAYSWTSVLQTPEMVKNPLVIAI